MFRDHFNNRYRVPFTDQIAPRSSSIDNLCNDSENFFQAGRFFVPYLGHGNWKGVDGFILPSCASGLSVSLTENVEGWSEEIASYFTTHPGLSAVLARSAHMLLYCAENERHLL